MRKHWNYHKIAWIAIALSCAPMAHALILSALSPFARADERPIAQIISSDGRSWPLYISGPTGKRRAVDSPNVFEGDSIRTTFRQHITLIFDEKTKLILGPQSDLKISNWTERDRNNRLIRKFTLTRGIVHIKTERPYSQEEPLVVETPHSATSTIYRTDFVVEVTDKQSSTHVFTGIALYARSWSDLQAEATRVTIESGKATAIGGKLTVPPPAQLFDMNAYIAFLGSLPMPGLLTRAVATAKWAPPHSKSTTKRRAAELRLDDAPVYNKKRIE